MTVQDMPIGELIPYENNPRYNDEAVDKVAASIRDFGFRVPILALLEFCRLACNQINITI